MSLLDLLQLRLCLLVPLDLGQGVVVLGRGKLTDRTLEALQLPLVLLVPRGLRLPRFVPRRGGGCHGAVASKRSASEIAPSISLRWQLPSKVSRPSARPAHLLRRRRPLRPSDPALGLGRSEEVRLRSPTPLTGRMRASSVLLVTLRGIAVEVAKNIVLAGIGSITLLDPEDVVEEDLGANFFLREDDVGRKVRIRSAETTLSAGQRVEAAAPRVQALNPRVDVLTCTEREKLEDEQFLSTFDLIVVTECDAPSLVSTF